MRKTARKRPAELEYTPANCTAREILARIGDKWSVYVMHVLGDAGTLRFNEVRDQVDGISQRMLTVTLRNLERDGLVSRTVTPSIPPRVDYELTELGQSLQKPICGLANWATENVEAIHEAQARFDAERDEGSMAA